MAIISRDQPNSRTQNNIVYGNTQWEYNLPICVEHMKSHVYMCKAGLSNIGIGASPASPVLAGPLF